MKKLFISQPMSGRSKEEIFKEREYHKKELEREFGEEFELLDTYFDLGESATALDYIAKSIEYLSKADLVYFVDGWVWSKGCIVEYECCIQYGFAMLRDNLCVMQKGIL